MNDTIYITFYFLLIGHAQKRKKNVHGGTVFYHTPQTFILEGKFFLTS